MPEEFHKKYRPRTLERVLGAPQTVASLAAMLEKHTLPHTILFSGPSGCGKTTLARILKDVLSCHDLDYREVNSGSFRGIDSIREVQRTMNLQPCGGPVRVWLFDECHKWSNDAQNAALKILEDTPSHVYFFLATTDPNKLIKAVLTRCTEMPVRLLTTTELQSLLNRICKKEQIELQAGIMQDLIESAAGSARTALVLLEKIASLPADQQAQAIQDKLAEENEAIELCRAIFNKSPWKKIAEILKNLKGEPESVRWCVLGYARSVLLNKGDWNAYNVIRSFDRNFYDSKESGLAAAAYEALHAKP